MTTEPQHLFWDSCVFIRYLTGEPAEGVADIEQYLSDAVDGKVTINFSTIAFTEIKPQFLRKKQYGDINDFLADFEGAFSPISPSPDILARAGALRDPYYQHAVKDPRVVGTPDAIHLMTCVHARDVLGLDGIVFHTFDDGKGRNWEGKCVSLLSFQDWTTGLENNELVQSVVRLPRQKPCHPEPLLFRRGSP